MSNRNRAHRKLMGLVCACTSNGIWNDSMIKTRQTSNDSINRPQITISFIWYYFFFVFRKFVHGFDHGCTVHIALRNFRGEDRGDFDSGAHNVWLWITCMRWQSFICECKQCVWVCAMDRPTDRPFQRSIDCCMHNLPDQKRHNNPNNFCSNHICSMNSNENKNRLLFGYSLYSNLVVCATVYGMVQNAEYHPLKLDCGAHTNTHNRHPNGETD